MTESSVSDLVSALASGTWSSTAVTTAFCKRATIAQQLVNRLTEILFSNALVRAQKCDDYLAKEGKSMGPLHGLPISFKDVFAIKGVEASIGDYTF